jgi:hypothetical protein
MQDKLTAGDSLSFSTAVADYPASAGWTLKYRLVPRFTAPVQAPITLTATADGDDYKVAVAASTTATWAAGAYGWASWVEKAGEEYTVEKGQIEIDPNPRQIAQGVDTRSLAQRTYDDLLAARAGWQASQGRVKKYSIAGREMEFFEAAAIDAEITFWRRQLAEETLAADLTAAVPRKNRILTRFSRAS